MRIDQGTSVCAYPLAPRSSDSGPPPVPSRQPSPVNCLLGRVPAGIRGVAAGARSYARSCGGVSEWTQPAYPNHRAEDLTLATLRLQEARWQLIFDSAMATAHS